jgi:hypothetical protein
MFPLESRITTVLPSIFTLAGTGTKLPTFVPEIPTSEHPKVEVEEDVPAQFP